MNETKGFLKRHGNKIVIVGVILGTAIVTYIAARKGFTSILDGYTMNISEISEEGIKITKF